MKVKITSVDLEDDLEDITKQLVEANNLISTFESNLDTR